MIFRAAFWIGVGYLVVQPGQPDGSNGARQIGEALVQTGSRAVLEYTAADNCTDLRCSVIRAAVQTTSPGLVPGKILLRQDIALLPPAPVPPPRPPGAR